VTVTGKGNYSGSKILSFTILPMDISNLTVGTINTQVYTGSAVTPVPSVKRNYTTLTSGTDFDLSYSNNINASSEAKCTITMKGNYTGSAEVTFKINPRSISYATVAEISSYTYTGSEIKPCPAVKDGTVTLKENTDFTYSYANNITVPTSTYTSYQPKVMITGTGNYTGTKTVYFTIEAKDISGLTFSSISDQTYNGSYRSPAPTVTWGTKTLSSSSDYYLSYNNNLNAGTASVTVKGKNNFKGEKTISFKILPMNIADLTLGSINAQTYTGTAITPAPNVMRGSVYLTKGTDYDLSYSDNINASSNAKCTITMKGNYTGTKTITFKINPASVYYFTMPTIPEQTYTGSPIEPSIAITMNGKAVTKDIDYTLAFSNNTNAGYASVTITGIGNYCDSITRNFRIVKSTTPTGSPTNTPTGTPTNTPTNNPTTPPTPAPTGNPVTNTPSPVPSENTSTDQIRAFVDRLYTCVLEREPETDGANWWFEELYSFNQTGAQAAKNFVFCDEFISHNKSNAEFVDILYATFFGREADEAGRNYWVGLLESGASRETVADGFIYSQEWADTCAEYGIRSGGNLMPQVRIKPTEQTYAFVERLYSTALNRSSDQSGLEYWADHLSNFEMTGESVGVDFFLSQEMEGFGLSNEEYLNRLYVTFMNREPDEAGFNFWLGLLQNGATRRDVVLGFTRSPEFIEKCVEARILPF
ncbi:MAG: DUF4214 domain-containing protein, partial [Clostridiales bacterium]|nr:DUF4214 domain-containing protein [Clostridiales bacterium]